MSIIDTLVTDRKQSDVDRLKALNEKGCDNMTDDERGEWRYGKLIPMLGPDGEQLQDVNGEMLYCRDGIQRGCYGVDDLNRVGEAMNYVAERLMAQGYSVAISPKTDWNPSDWPTPQTMTRYLSDLEELRRQFAMLASTPQVPADMAGLTVKEANDIEEILEDIDLLLTNAAQAWLYSGDLFSGEV